MKIVLSIGTAIVGRPKTVLVKEFSFLRTKVSLSIS
jgi:hypothetical protein